jgi:hypothetical protein
MECPMIKKTIGLACVVAALIVSPLGHFAGLAVCEAGKDDAHLRPYVDVLEKQALAPVDFVLNAMKNHQLLIFDDGLHTAVEPFEFYQQILETPAFNSRVKTVFIELLPLTRQPAIDAYLSADEENPELLFPAFQDATGFGLAYKTYFDLMRTIYNVNATLPDAERLKVYGVNSPTYWSEIRTSEELALYRDGKIGRDNYMYGIILDRMNSFETNARAMFLTNSRHAYNGIRQNNGQFYWNTATFFRQWHPGATYTIRFHSPSLHLERRAADPTTARTDQGLEDKIVKWARIGDGIWDSAFAALQNRPMGFALPGTPFGREPYIGNHMLDVKPGQTMGDAYDGVIFLAPMEALRKTAILDIIYTDEFKLEVARRYRIHYTDEQLKTRFERYGVSTLQEMAELLAEAEEERRLPQANVVGPIDEWKAGKNRE